MTNKNRLTICELFGIGFALVAITLILFPSTMNLLVQEDRYPRSFLFDEKLPFLVKHILNCRQVTETVSDLHISHDGIHQINKTTSNPRFVSISNHDVCYQNIFRSVKIDEELPPSEVSKMMDHYLENVIYVAYETDGWYYYNNFVGMNIPTTTYPYSPTFSGSKIPSQRIVVSDFLPDVVGKFSFKDLVMTLEQVNPQAV